MDGLVKRNQTLDEAADAIEELSGFVQEAERDRDEYKERLDRTNDLMQKQWIPVTERLPEENGNYLVSVKCPRGKWVEICACDGRDWVSVDEYAEYATKWVTHWMPLPEPPKGENHDN